MNEGNCVILLNYASLNATFIDIPANQHPLILFLCSALLLPSVYTNSHPNFEH